MLCTFTTETGILIVRSDDIRILEDKVSDGGAVLVFMVGDGIHSRAIHGTARENADRIQQEELDLIARVEGHRYETQKQLQAGYPVPPVKRGKQ